jgi:hypothetical protein
VGSIALAGALGAWTTLSSGRVGAWIALAFAMSSLVVLLLGLALAWSPLLPPALLLLVAGYVAHLAIDDVPLDRGAPLFAAGLLAAAELAYWSLEERSRVAGEPGESFRRLAFVTVLALASLVVGQLALTLVDLVQARGLAVDALGAAAVVGILLAVWASASRGGQASA